MAPRATAGRLREFIRTEAGRSYLPEGNSNRDCSRTSACAGSSNAMVPEIMVSSGPMRAPTFSWAPARCAGPESAGCARAIVSSLPWRHRSVGRRPSISGGCRHEGTAPWLQGPDRSGCRHCPVLVAYGPKGCLYWRHRPGGNIVAGRRAGKPGGRVRLRGRGYRVYRIAVLIATASGRPPGVSRKTCRLRWPDWARGTSEPGGAVSVALVSRRQPDAPQGIPTTDA